MTVLRFFVALLIAFRALPLSSAGADEPVVDSENTAAPLDASLPESGRDRDAASARRNRVLVIFSSESVECVQELKLLEAIGGPFELLRKRGWTIGKQPQNHIEIVDKAGVVSADVEGVVSSLDPKSAPVVIYVESGQIARSFQHGCTTPLDQWTFGWLMTGNDERPVAFESAPIEVTTTGHYPLRGNHWSVEGNWNPSREYVIQHLRSAHRTQLLTSWNIETWSLEELRSVHDDLHDREEGFRGRYSEGSSSRPSNRQGSGIRKPGRASR